MGKDGRRGVRSSYLAVFLIGKPSLCSSTSKSRKASIGFLSVCMFFANRSKPNEFMPPSKETQHFFQGSILKSWRTRSSANSGASCFRSFCTGRVFFDLVGVYITFDGALVPSSAAWKKKNGSFIFPRVCTLPPEYPTKKKRSQSLPYLRYISPGSI